MSESQYDSFAEIYDVWTRTTGELARANREFYVEEYLAADGPVIELGVGSGRIALEAVRRGAEVIGVDDSSRMLADCRRAAEAEGLTDRIQLIEASMCTFEAPQPAALITIPFHSIGHVVDLEEKRALVSHVHSQLAPGGRFVFDVFVYDPEIAKQFSAPRLHAEYVDPETGRDVLLWVCSKHDVPAQTMRIVTWTDELDGEGVVQRRKYRRLDFSWLEPDQARSMLEEAGFEIEAVHGDFDRTPFGEGSGEHIWVARRA